MNRLRSLLNRRRLAVLGMALAVVAVGLIYPLTRAQADETFTNRVALGRDIAKLAIVVMANQTPITAADAKGVLSVLQAIKAEDVISEKEASSFNEQLHSAFSSDLKQAISVVRMPEARPEVKSRLRQLAERRNFRNPAKSGPASHAFDRLIEFFTTTAAQ